MTEQINSASQNQLQEVTLDIDQFDAYTYFVRGQDTVDVDTIRAASSEQSDGLGDLSDDQALGIFERLQSAGVISLQAGEDGSFSVLKDNPVAKVPQRVEPRVSIESRRYEAIRRRRIAGKIAALPGMKSAIRTGGEKSDSWKLKADHLNHNVNGVVTTVKSKSPAGKDEAARTAASEASETQRRVQERQIWQSGRKTNLVLEESKPATHESIALQEETIATSQEYEHIDKYIEQAIKDRVRETSDDGRLLPRETFRAITAEVRLQAVKEFLGDEATDEEVEEYLQQLGAFKMQRNWKPRGRR